ncbi:hypothetical protein Aperf_G00000021114 [Anoplocephala perfoliata]
MGERPIFGFLIRRLVLCSWVAVFILLVVVLLSFASHLYSLCIALKLFEPRDQNVKSGTANRSYDDQCGPSVFKKSVPHLPLLASTAVPTCLDPPIDSQRSARGSSYGQLYVSTTTQAPILKISPIRESPSSVYNLTSPFGDYKRLSPSSVSSSMYRTSLTNWGTRSPNTTSPVAALQYQLSTSQSSSGLLDSSGSYSTTVGRRRSMDEAIEALFASSPCADDANDDIGLGRMKRKGQKSFDAPEKNASDYWKSNGVSELDLERWTVNVRRWLHGTVLRRVADEINAVNAKIADFADDAPLLGSMTLDRVEQLAKGCYQHISTLPMLIKFLNLTKDQTYLVHRIQELARGHCLADFKWDAGSRSTTLPWKDYLPNDTLILLHIFSTYMDHLLPPDAKCFSNGVFSLLHFVRSPDLPDLKSKYNAQIYLTAVQPPMVKIVIDGTVYAFLQDRFNLYHSMLMFFHFYKSLDGSIRSISLGPSGLNIAWVFEKR